MTGVSEVRQTRASKGSPDAVRLLHCCLLVQSTNYASSTPYSIRCTGMPTGASSPSALHDGSLHYDLQDASRAPVEADLLTSTKVHKASIISQRPDGSRGTVFCICGSALVHHSPNHPSLPTLPSSPPPVQRGGSRIPLLRSTYATLPALG